ncbi:MAG TPA: aminopeptidase P family protein [Clostridiaceae bacterium]|nr:aminopeptidase P family protein [Clostridiaceae bacterium]
MDIKKRLRKFREGLIKRNLDAALITKRENYFYMSGFTGTAAHLLITRDNALLITDFRYIEQAEKEAPLYEVVQHQHGTLIATINKLVKKTGINSLGFEESDLTYGKYSEFKEKLDIMDFVPLKGLVEELRVIKDQDELAVLKKAVEIADNAFVHVLNYIKPDIREIEIAAEIEYFMKKSGATGSSFDTIVASGLRSSMPHGVASEKKLRMGDPVTLDYGALYGGYCSDITRTVFLGKPSPELIKIYNIVLKAQLESLEHAHKGRLGKEVDMVAREIILKEGYGEYFGHGLGHGVGLEIHEEPRFSPMGTRLMENGMVVTVEPGIYVSGIGGVRIEDMIVINDTNPIILTKAKKDMIIL